MNKKHLLTIGLAIILFYTFYGCDQRVEPEEPKGDYLLQGSFVKNLDDNILSAAVYVERDSLNIQTAQINITENSLAYNSDSGIYLFGLFPISGFDSGNYYLEIQNTPDLKDSVNFRIPRNFQITDIALPEDRINPGGAEVQITWAPSLNSDGYILAVVEDDMKYQAGGFAEFVEAGYTIANIPLDAFRLSGALDTGWYHVYVYSYTGSPAGAYNLPTAIPEGLSDNINRPKFYGSFGTVVVTGRETIHVVAE